MIPTTLDWTKITVPKLRSLKLPTLGQRARDKRGRNVPLSDSERRQLGKLSRHWRCESHVRVDGYREQLCIERGRDESDVVREALELNEGQPPSSTGVWLLV